MAYNSERSKLLHMGLLFVVSYIPYLHSSFTHSVVVVTLPEEVCS